MKQKKEMKKRQISIARAHNEKTFVLKNAPTNENEQNNLADELMEWVQNEEIYTIESFHTYKKIKPKQFYNIQIANDYFSEALLHSKYVISNRLQNSWRQHKVDREYALRLLPLYHPEYRSYSLEKSVAHAQGTAKGNAIFTIIQDSIPDSGIKKKGE